MHESSHDSLQDLKSIAQSARTWLFESAGPRWLHPPDTGVPLFPERMSVTGEIDTSRHRVMVQARHIYSFAELGRLGWQGPWKACVEATIELLLRRARRADGFFVHALTNDGQVADGRADLYDQAFMLFAFANAGRALGRSDLFVAADALADTLIAHWSHPQGGFSEGEIVAQPTRRQNPHMHLFEVSIALQAATGQSRWTEFAEMLQTLCSKRFIDPATGALLEYFTDDLQPIPGEMGTVVEPGHCFEWAWLFEILTKAGHAEPSVSDRLVEFARAHGIDGTRGVAINEVYLSGAVRDGKARLWPQTERLKAAVARFGRTRAAGEAAEAVRAYRGLQTYLDPQIPGTWKDKFLPDGSFLDEPVPGSSLYHIVCGLSELIGAADLASGA